MGSLKRAWHGAELPCTIPFFQFNKWDLHLVAGQDESCINCLWDLLPFVIRTTDWKLDQSNNPQKIQTQHVGPCWAYLGDPIDQKAVLERPLGSKGLPQPRFFHLQPLPILLCLWSARSAKGWRRALNRGMTVDQAKRQTVHGCAR